MALLSVVIWCVLLGAIGVAFIVGARPMQEWMMGILPHQYRPVSIGWWKLLPWRLVGAVIVSVAVLLLVFAIWRFDAIDRCLDAGGNWVDDDRICQGPL